MKTKTSFRFMAILLLALSITLLLTSCETKQDIQTDIETLRSQRTALQSEIEKLTSTKQDNQKEVSDLTEKLKELHLYEGGITPKYILKIHLKQSHLSFSIKEHIKDAMNAIDFELPVDKDFYHQVQVGTDIVNEFRTGSLILRGSFGSWVMTVQGKEMRK